MCGPALLPVLAIASTLVQGAMGGMGGGGGGGGGPIAPAQIQTYNPGTGRENTDVTVTAPAASLDDPSLAAAEEGSDRQGGKGGLTIRPIADRNLGTQASAQAAPRRLVASGVGGLQK